MVNGPQNIFYEKFGCVHKWEQSFASEEKMQDIIQQIVGRHNRVVNLSNPIVDTRLSDGSRVNIVLSPISLDGSAITIRKFPEHPLDMETLIEKGAISKEDAMLTKKQLKEKKKRTTYPSVSYEIADEISKRTGMEIRITVPGHMQRGGSPCPYDRVLATRLGAAAAGLILQKNYGNMVGIVEDKVVAVPLEEVAGKLKKINPEADIIQETRDLGISFGDC